MSLSYFEEHMPISCHWLVSSLIFNPKWKDMTKKQNKKNNKKQKKKHKKKQGAHRP